MKTQRRVKGIRVHGSFIPQFFRTGIHHFDVVEGLPEGAKFMSFNLDPYLNILIVVVEHDSFDLVSEGDPLPFIDITAKDLRHGNSSD